MGPEGPRSAGDRPAGAGARVLVVLPSWVGDTVMATPAIGLLRSCLRGGVMVAVGRPGAAELLAGSGELDEVLDIDARSLAGPARAAARLRPLRMDAAVILPNSFASAVGVRLAGVPVRVGYDRDGRGMLLTHRLAAPRRDPARWERSGWEPVSAVVYYLRAAWALLVALRQRGWAVGGVPEQEPGMAGAVMRLGVPPGQAEAARRLLVRAGVPEGELAGDAPGGPSGASGAGLAVINPGGNNPAKRWPVERFAVVAHHLIARRGMRVVINGSPAEAGLAAAIRDAVRLISPGLAAMIASLPEHGVTLGSLKGVIARAAVLVTNDTGPRHIAAALGRPCVTLFGPTDPRWTSLPEDRLDAGPCADPGGHADAGEAVGAGMAGDECAVGLSAVRGRPREAVITPAPPLPASMVADEHPERCRIQGIPIERVIGAVEAVLGGATDRAGQAGH